MVESPAWRTDTAPVELLDGGDAVALAGQLTTWQPVDRRRVHKTALAEVLVTDLRPLGDGVFAAASQWPRAHALFQPRPDTAPSPLLFVETLRQAGIYLSHEHLGVPLDHQFVFESMSARYLEPGPRPRPDQETVVVLAIRVDAERAGAWLGRVRLEFEAWSGATRFATARAAYRCLPPAVYRRLRAAATASAPGIPAPRRPAEVPVEPVPGGTTSVVDVDVRHPTFFDHPVGHLPGMLLVDAALRAAAPEEYAGRTSSEWGFHLVFERFAELAAPTTVTTTGRETHDVGVVVAQPGGPVAAGIVRR